MPGRELTVACFFVNVAFTLMYTFMAGYSIAQQQSSGFWLYTSLAAFALFGAIVGAHALGLETFPVPRSLPDPGGRWTPPAETRVRGK